MPEEDDQPLDIDDIQIEIPDKANVESNNGERLDRFVEPQPDYDQILSSSIHYKAHPVDFLQAVNEIPEINFATNN